MLDPQDRELLLEALRPPEGYDLSFAIGTTYTLDLLALLTAPLGFTLFELACPPGADLPPGDAVRLLGVLRRYADRLAVFCEAGRIAVPPKHAILFGELERSVIEVRPPDGRSFHPKVWALRFEREGAPVRYRVLCMTRNLTFDASWDTMLVLDGVLHAERKVGYSANRPLADFFAALPSMAVGGAPEHVANWVRTAADELRRVHFDLPEPFEDYTFFPFGIEGYRDQWIFEKADRTLVVAPFLSPGTLHEIVEYVGDATLVSRTDALDAIPREVLREFSKVYAFNPDAVPEQPSSDESAPADPRVAAGLHAKLFVLDQGWNSCVLTGSANATKAAFEGNVEFVTELIGKKSKCGVESILEAGGAGVGLANLLVEYDLDSPVVPADAALEAQHDLLDRIRRALGGVQWQAAIAPGAPDSFRVTLSALEPVVIPGEAKVTVVPVLLPQSAAAPLAAGTVPSVTFESVSFEGLTSFFAFDVKLVGVADQEPCRFVVNARLVGEPEGRRERITQYLLRDREQVVRFLLTLLSGTSDDIGAGMQIGATGPEARNGRDGAGESSALLEPLLRALDRDPRRLDEIAAVLKDLESTDDGRAKLPPGLEHVWAPIWEARQALREGQPS